LFSQNTLKITGCKYQFPERALPVCPGFVMACNVRSVRLKANFKTFRRWSRPW